MFCCRLWDLSAIKEKKNAADKIRAGRRLSLLTMMSSNKDGSDSGRVSCVGKVSRARAAAVIFICYYFIYYTIIIIIIPRSEYAELASVLRYLNSLPTTVIAVIHQDTFTYIYT